MTTVRRALLQGGFAMAAVSAVPPVLWAQSAAPVPAKHLPFEPQPGPWRTFEITTRVQLADPVGRTRIWLPVPSIDSDWQRSLESHYRTSGEAAWMADGIEGTRMLKVEFAAGVTPWVELSSRVQTRNRAWQQRASVAPTLDRATRRHYTRATEIGRAHV